MGQVCLHNLANANVIKKCSYSRNKLKNMLEFFCFYFFFSEANIVKSLYKIEINEKFIYFRFWEKKKKNLLLLNTILSNFIYIPFY